MNMAMLRRAAAMTLLLIAGAAPLGGCSSLLTQGSADAAGVAGAGIAGAVSKDAAVGAAIGLGVASIAGAGVQYAERRSHRTEQDRIAEVAGALPIGGIATWNVVHTLPIEPNEGGQVAISRTVGGADFACKEIVFSVDGGTSAQPERAFYTAMICRDGDRWKWATAEPATERWGALQ
jgi:hypothetical protein